MIKTIKLNEKVADYFPYAEVRPHQDEFIKAIFEAVENGCSLLIEGSNGLGKTISALTACLPKAVDEKFKVLYVARTHRQHERVVEELKAISRKQPVSGISVRGRREMCLNDFVTKNVLDIRTVMEICEMLKTKHRCPYYVNIEKKTEEYSELKYYLSLKPCSATEIQRICRRKGFCPYELVKSSLAEINVVALSYLYMFDKLIRNAFLRNLETPLSKIILIIDEAHNLPETAVDIASSSLSLYTIKQAETEAKKFKCNDIADFAKNIRNKIEEAAEKIVKEELVSPEFLTDLVREEPYHKTFFERIHDTGMLIKQKLLLEGLYPRSFIHGMGFFLLRWLETAENQAFVNVISKYMTGQGTSTAKVEIAALDPSEITASVFSSVYSSIVMSGTLQPLDTYAKIAKLPEDTLQKIVHSPFSKEHILPLVSCGITTAMKRRTPSMYKKIIKRIEEVVHCTPANTGLFAPSFDVLRALLAEGLEEALNKPLFFERRNMSSKENEKMVADFKTLSEHGGAVLLGVQGGRSSEGVDYPGDEMNSVGIVGVPYAEPTPKVKAKINYFDMCYPGFGREYGYVLPAMKKASQVAGRPIRTLEDKGAMVFLDHRFATEYCQSFFPSWISSNLRILPDKDGVIAHELESFFKVC